MMIADICAEAVFSRFWAERTAATFIIQALLQDATTVNPKPAVNADSDKTALRPILREFQQKRAHQTLLHVHSMPVRPLLRRAAPRCCCAALMLRDGARTPSDHDLGFVIAGF